MPNTSASPSLLALISGLSALLLVGVSAGALANVVIEPGQVILHDTRATGAKSGDGYAHAIELLFPDRSVHAYHCDQGEYMLDGYESAARVAGNCHLVLSYVYPDPQEKSAADDVASVAGYSSLVKLTQQGAGGYLTFNQCRFDTARRYKVLDGGVLRLRNLMSFTCNPNTP
jgi:hypothetical protein